MNLPYPSRVEIYKAALGIVPIDMKVIRRLAFQGIPDDPGLRSTYWKLLLGFLPRHQDIWEEETQKQRSIYQEWIQELILDPHAKYVSTTGGGFLGATIHVGMW